MRVIKNLFKNKVFIIILCTILGTVVAFSETMFIRGSFAEIEYVLIATAREEIDKHGSLTAELKKFPKEFYTNDMITDLSYLDNKASSKVIQKENIIYKSDLVDYILPTGDDFVKVTFATTLTDAVAGQVGTGDTVDIGYIDNNTAIAEIIFEDVYVELLTDRDGTKLNKPRKNEYELPGLPATVTVIIKKDNALLLKSYENQGKLFLML